MENLMILSRICRVISDPQRESHTTPALRRNGPTARQSWPGERLKASTKRQMNARAADTPRGCTGCKAPYD